MTCVDCGEPLGSGASWEADVVGDRHAGFYAAGCVRCASHLEREAAEARTDRAVDAHVMREGRVA
jgi:hypothetical protein